MTPYKQAKIEVQAKEVLVFLLVFVAYQLIIFGICCLSCPPSQVGISFFLEELRFKLKLETQLFTRPLCQLHFQDFHQCLLDFLSCVGTKYHIRFVKVILVDPIEHNTSLSLLLSVLLFCISGLRRRWYHPQTLGVCVVLGLCCLMEIPVRCQDFYLH